MTDKLITAKEFANATRYNQVYVYQLIKDGKIKAVRIGDKRTLRIPESELERYISGGMSGKEGNNG